MQAADIEHRGIIKPATPRLGMDLICEGRLLVLFPFYLLQGALNLDSGRAKETDEEASFFVVAGHAVYRG